MSGHTSPLRLLVVDDNRSAAQAILLLLEREGHVVEACYDGQSAIDTLERHRLEGRPFDLVFTDLRMEPVDGMQVVRAARHGPDPSEVIVFTAYGSVDAAVEAMRLGALDFLTKPVTAEQLLARVRNLGAAVGVALQIVGASRAAEDLRTQATKLVQVRSTVLVIGETGSGRTHFARFLHARGPDADRELVVLRPHEDVSSRQLLDAGTLLVQSVDDWPTAAFGGLLRQLEMLEAGVPPRVIATASPDVDLRVAEGRIPPELYFRLAVLVVRIPPLRERSDDLLPLLTHFLELHSRAFAKKAPGPLPEQLSRLALHGWPGNAREVSNLAERAVVLGSSAFEMQVKPASSDGDVVPTLEEGFQLSTHLEQIERSVLLRAIEQTSGDRPAMCRLLGVERNTLRYKLNKYSLLDRVS